VTFVQPTPTFGKTVLFTMRSIEEASLLRRSWSEADFDPSRLVQDANIQDIQREALSLPALRPGNYHDALPAASAFSTYTSVAFRAPQSEGKRPVLAARGPQTTRYTTTYTTTTATRLIRPTSRTRTKTSSRPSRTPSSPKPTHRGTGSFQAMYVCLPVSDCFASQGSACTLIIGLSQIGPMGVCLDQKDAFRVCSSASL